MSEYYSIGELYTKFNAKFWGGRLPQEVQGGPGLAVSGPANERGILVRRVNSVEDLEVEPGRPLVTGRFFKPQGDRPAEIRVLGYLKIGAAQEHQTLLHEMVHFALWFAGMPDEGHGPRFLAELDRLADAGEEWARQDAEKYRSGLLE